jgi:hypothetical protein
MNFPHRARSLICALTFAVALQGGCASTKQIRADGGLPGIWPTSTETASRWRVDLTRSNSSQHTLQAAIEYAQTSPEYARWLFAEAVRVSDQNCIAYLASLRGLGASWDLFGTAAGVSGSLVGGVNAAKILSGVSGFFSGVKPESFYYQGVSRSLITQTITARRAAIKKQINDTLHAAGFDPKRDSGAIFDQVNTYHATCWVQPTVDYLGLLVAAEAPLKPKPENLVPQNEEKNSSERSG